MNSTNIEGFEDSVNDMDADSKLFVDKSLEINYRIHNIMGRKGISQKQLADIMGKHEEEVSKWLSGVHNFTLRTLCKLENALGESIVYPPQHVPQINEI